MQVEDKKVNLSPGMAVTAEIKTGSRRIISYLLSPLIKYRQEESAREMELEKQQLSLPAIPSLVACS